MTGGRLQRTLEPSVLRWARERAGLDAATVATKIGVAPDRVVEWERWTGARVVHGVALVAVG